MENSPSSSDSNVFSVRIVSIDYYMSSPIPGIDLCYSSFQGGKVNEVPVIRIYGSTPAGQKTCLHVHRALPYLYVPCSDISHQLGQSGEACAQAISLALEKALKLKGSAGSKRQHVHGFSLVWARRFYGYDPSEELYVKLYLYYPQDVSRAANLLLGGSVLEKSLQPHESHIPFLLQFLVDYNLYGMGHLHVSKVKFRPPVPSFFMKKKANYYAQHKQNTDESSMGTNFQADSCSDGCLGSPVWISSTIPDGWTWHSTSDDQDFCPAKRQSACDLEGDAAIDDILNQQCKLYLSLSQTLSNVRMVQSLIPIWEEFERTGTHVETMPPDPGKPHPEDVLVTLSNGLEYANKLMELCDADNSIPCTLVKNGRMSLQSLKSEGGGKDAVGTSQAYSETGSSKRLQSSNDRIGPIFTQDSECQGAGKPCEERDESPVKLSNDELQSLEANLPHCLKVADPEALRLLKWLASSQAAEDINSDDELTRETILSPLITAITINKMLEKADMDFECASQQECQDILDSVEDIIGVEGKNKRSSQTQPLDCTYQLSSKKAIKIDGYADDQKVITCTGKTSKIVNRECEKPLKLRMQPDCGSSISRMHKRKGSLWSSLPFSSSENMNDGLPANMKAGTCDRETNDCNGTCLLAAEDASGCRNVVMDGAKNNIRSTKVTNTIVGCSVRDLMRRKRRHRSEPTGVENHHDGNITPEEESDSYSFSSKSSDEQDIRPPTSSNSRSRFIGESENIDKDLNVENSVGEACGKAFNVKHKASFCSTYGKLPLSTRREPLSTSNGCGQGRDDMVVERAASGSSNLKVTDFTAGHGGIRSLPYFTNFENQNSSPQLNHEKSFQMDSNDVLTLDGNQQLPWTGKQLQRDAAISSALITCSSESEMVQKNAYDSDIGFKRKTPSGVLGTSSVNFEDMEIMNGAILMQSGNGHNDTDGRDPSLIPCNPSTEVNSVESTAFRFCKKPPVIELTYGLSAAVTPGCCSSADGDKVGNKDGDDCPPFFEGDYQELQHTQSKTDELIHRRKQVMGVPSHDQNDGSCLYMLTPSLLPPSLEVVNGWLLRDGTVADVLTEDITVSTAECSSLKESISNQADSQEASAGEHNEAFVESGPTFSAETNMDHVNKQDQGSHFIRLQPLDTGVATVHQTGGETSQTKQHGVVSQDISQISGPDGKPKLTPLSQAGFRDPASVGAGQQLTLFSIEVQAESRGDLRPDPRFDAISFIALIIQEDDQSIIDCYVLLQGVMVTERRNLDGISDCKLLFCSEEKHLFNEFIKIICNYDPDILMGWDIQGGSLGFLAERAAHLGIGLLNKISRTPSQPIATARDSDIPDTGMVSEVVPEALITDSSRQNDAIIEDEWGRTHASGVHVGGRIVLNIWRLVRSEVRLNFYTVEAVAEAVLRRKIPFIQWKTLTKWFASGPGRARHRCIDYVLERAKLNIQIMNQLDMINRTSELARVFGIDFFSVLSRGSQYRVESMLLRLAHTQNYLALSPGSQQVASQPAMECIPLVMEPESGFYTDPVVVLDFQSLYPSMIIAYNLCFSTCLGKVTPAKPNILGVSSYKPNPDILQDLKDEVLLTPNGVMYVPSKVRKGVLPRLLDEILSTRIMVKHAMKKLSPSEKVLHRIYNARQLALKLIANVTYGYTAAGFSGRMPCAELADSIVQCGRRTLENAILLVNTHDKWKAKVIYGDTDSMFVLLPGRSVGEAFQIGNEIASEVSKMNPNPVVLKMEKVYHPCFLLTKKRYVGYSYEKPGQVKPIFDAKGIETVRRDTCGAVSKTMEQSLRLFFEHQDVNEVKSYLLRQWTRILSGRVSLQDFVFAKEVRLGTYSSRTSSLPPAAIVATKAMRADPRAEPRYAERIPYVVVHGEPGARLVDMVVDPLDLLAIDSPFRLNDVYYIKKQIIPALQRVFGLVGVDLNQWFLDMPRPVRESIAKRQSPALNSHRTRIDYYYLSKHCVMCGELVQASAAPLCDLCSRNKAAAAVAVTGRTSKLEREMQHLAAICRHCGGGDWIIESGVKCTSLACSVFYERRKVQKELQSLSTVATESGFYPKCMAEWF